MFVYISACVCVRAYVCIGMHALVCARASECVCVCVRESVCVCFRAFHQSATDLSLFASTHMFGCCPLRQSLESGKINIKDGATCSTTTVFCGSHR